MGGEAISSNEYLGVGKVTEFRYGLKMAQCIRSNDFNCLGGIYDQGWGMVDGMHAVVFVDNHDNQRGHGGGGGGQGAGEGEGPRLHPAVLHLCLRVWLDPSHRPPVRPAIGAQEFSRSS